MGPPGAKQGDTITGVDTHLIQPPGPCSPVVVPHPFSGTLDAGLSGDVSFGGMPAAVVGSGATNTPHVPIGGTFVNPPVNRGKVQKGSGTVFINGKPAARTGDPALTCDDPADAPVGSVVAAGQVFVGG
jgi:uncharacterized Zn-binding protein involved in type VI secretion